MHNKDTIYITGIAGFFGSHLSSLYLKNGYRVIGYDIKAPRFSHNNLVLISGELSETEKIKASIIKYKPSHFIHLAGLIKSKSARTLYDVNVFGTQSVCEAISASGLSPKMNLISSSAVYGPCNEGIPEHHECVPVTDYGMTKKIQEEIVGNYFKRGCFPCTIYRPFNLIGDGMSIELAVASFIEKIKIAKQHGISSIEVGNLTAIRDYIDIRDAASVVFKLFDDEVLNNEVINICSGVGYKMSDILIFCCDILNFYPEIRVNKEFVQKNDVSFHVGNAEKLRKYYNIELLSGLHNSLTSMINNQAL